MRSLVSGILGICVSGLPLVAQIKPPEAPKSDAAYIRMAESGGPLGVARGATIVRFGADGKAIELRKGSNGFTCSILIDVVAMPFCTDKNGWQFMVDLVAKQPKPTNNEPGVAYMAAGGGHLETAKGEVTMERTAGTRVVREPPHWMLLWPVDPATSALPTRPNASGVYIMFAGTPYAHLMLYQNPRLLEARPKTVAPKKPS